VPAPKTQMLAEDGGRETGGRAGVVAVVAWTPTDGVWPRHRPRAANGRADPPKRRRRRVSGPLKAEGRIARVVSVGSPPRSGAGDRSVGVVVGGEEC